MEKIRLQKYMADCGLMSRRAAEKEIEAGKVTVNGVTATVGESIVAGKDRVMYDGKPVIYKKRFVYYLLNKPQGIVTTMSDEFGRKTVRDLLPVKDRVYPVGRLDKDSEGLLLCTNDGDLANKLMHPSYHLKKTYIVNVRGFIEGSKADGLRALREIEGEKIAPADVSIVSRNENFSVLRFVISEGKNRQIRRMCEAVGLSVMQLRRVSIGGININGLEIGQYRPLTPKELSELKAAVEKRGRERNDKSNTGNRKR